MLLVVARGEPSFSMSSNPESIAEAIETEIVMFVARGFPAIVIAGLLGGGCHRPPSEFPSLQKQSEAPAAVPTNEPAPPLAEDEAALPKEARLAVLTRVALAKSPELAEARARTQAALARVKATGRLPDLEFKYELWGHPLAKPWAFNQTQMHMFGLRQAFPPSGALDAQSKMAVAEAKMALEAQHAKELDVVAEVRKAWASYHAAEAEKSIHLEHAGLTTKLLDLAKLQLQVGKASQADVLRLGLELTRVHADIVALDQQLVTSRARLNVLMGRDVDAPLGPAAQGAPNDVEPRMDVVKKLVAKRPELAAADSAVQKSEAALAGAKSEASTPSVMVGLDYQLMPHGSSLHGVGAMVQLSLPWLNPRHRDEVKAAEASVAAEKSAKAALEALLVLQVREAVARWEAARTTFTLVDQKLLPEAQKTFDALSASWSAGGGDSLAVVDALRMLLTVRIERSRALERLEMAVADVERAIGGPLPAAKEGKP